MTDGHGRPLAPSPYIRRPSGIGGRTSSGFPAGATVSDREARQLEGTGIRWSIEAVVLDRIVRGGVERARIRFRASLPDLIWNAAALEGNTFTLPEVKTLLDGITVGGRRRVEEEQVLALSEAYNLLDELVGDEGFELTKRVSDRLHGAVAVHEAIESGHFRGEGRVGGGGAVRLAGGGTVPGIRAGAGGSGLVARFDRLVAFLESIPDRRERALVYFAAATRSQFYFDGNKRTARLMMTGLLLSLGFEAVNIPFARSYEFNVALDALFNTDDATPLLAFVADCATGA